MFTSSVIFKKGLSIVFLVAKNVRMHSFDLESFQIFFVTFDYI